MCVQITLGMETVKGPWTSEFDIYIEILNNYTEWMQPMNNIL